MGGFKVDYGFGFNVPAFSNINLHIELLENSLDCKEDYTPNRKSKGRDSDKENENSLDSVGDCTPNGKSKGKDLVKKNENSLDSNGDHTPSGKIKGKDMENENFMVSKGDCTPNGKSKGKDLVKKNENSSVSKGDCTPNGKSKGKDLVKKNENSLDSKEDHTPNGKSKGKDLGMENENSLVSKGDCASSGKSKGNDLDKENESSLVSKGDCTPNGQGQGKDLDRENVIEVKTLHINSLILAARSLFFRKLFTIEMKESQQREVTLKINASEEAALMDVLNFMYSSTLNATTFHDLLGVLLVADKFSVESCMKKCSLLLKKIPMSLESALSYLDLPPSVGGSKVVEPLINAAKNYLVEHYSDFNKSQKEAMDLPLCAVEVVLGSAGLQVSSEDDVFDFVSEWASRHYPKLEERQEILTKHLASCICFLYMSFSKLMEVVMRRVFVSEEVSKRVSDALSKLASNAVSNADHNSLGRIYKLRPIKVMPLDFTQPRSVVFFELKREECANLSKSTCLKSRSFYLGGRWFYLTAQYSRESRERAFGLFLNMIDESESCTVDYEFAVVKKQCKEFQDKVKGNFKFDNSESRNCLRYPNLFRTPWKDFIDKDSDYFVDDILHLRADLSIKSIG